MYMYTGFKENWTHVTNSKWWIQGDGGWFQILFFNSKLRQHDLTAIVEDYYKCVNLYLDFVRHLTIYEFFALKEKKFNNATS